MQEEEDQLHGGNSADVIRVGVTVRRTTGPWSPGVHALLRYLEAQGFGAAPAFLGLDEQGREMLTFIAGEVGNYPLAPYMWSDEVLVEVAQLIRYYHDATVGFVAPESAQWQIVYPDASKHEVMCHNDLAPYNTVYLDTKPRALIDFDNAGPGPRAWDLAHAAYRFVPLMHLEDAETARAGLHTISQQGRRLRIFCDAYGIPAQAVLEMVEPRLRTLCTTLMERAAAGEGAFQKMLADGHLEYYERELTAFQEQRAELEIQIR
ncbi:MAG: phosphotransferase [Ktedonobacteraceae bacterium]